MHKAVSLLSTQTNAAVDNPIAPARPIPVSLNDSGLIASGAFAASPNALQRTDVLVVFDNSAASVNRPAADYYIYQNQGWRKIGQPLTQDFGADLVFGPGKAAFIRKAPSASAETVVWVNLPTYAP